MAIGYKHAGDIEVRSCKLILDNSQVVDISSLVKEANIYQDLFNHYIEADFVMDDSLNLFMSGFTGNELVEISFRNVIAAGATKDGTAVEETEYVRHIFQIYEISDKQKISEFREIYIMNCVSPEKYLSTPNKISRSYGPSLISSMVKKINDEFIYNDAAKSFYTEASNVFGFVKNKTGVFDETSGQHQYVIPNMPVDDAIMFLCKEADSSDHIPYYTFYEDADGFHFRNLSELVSQPVLYKYYHLPTATDNAGLDTSSNISPLYDDTFKIISYNVLKQSNILQNTNSGLFRHKTINIDIHRRKTNTVTYDYDNYSSKFKAIENRIVGGAEGTPLLTLDTTRKGHDSDSTLSSENHLPKTINETRAISKGYEKSLFNVVMEVTIPGNDEVKVGQLIELMFYVTDDDKISTETFDKYLSGNYLITKVRQKINGAKTGSEFITVIQCTRDGVRET